MSIRTENVVNRGVLNFLRQNLNLMGEKDLFIQKKGLRRGLEIFIGLETDEEDQQAVLDAIRNFITGTSIYKDMESRYQTQIATLEARNGNERDRYRESERRIQDNARETSSGPEGSFRGANQI